MSPEDREIVIGLLPETAGPVKIGLASDESRAGVLMSDFARQLTALAPNLRLQEDPDRVSVRPSLITGRFANIYFQGVPSGQILRNFLSAAFATAKAISCQDELRAEMLRKMETPLHLKLYIGQKCPFCPTMVKRLLGLATSTPLARVTIIEAAAFPHLAARDGIRSVPHTILDKRFEWTGLVETNEILKLGISRDPADMSPACLRQILEDGKAAQAAEMMIRSKKIFPALIDLLVDQRWPVRLGAMVAVEYLVSGAPRLAEELSQPVWQRFQESEEQIKGDLVYILGLIGTPEARQHLRRVIQSSGSRQVREAAMEVLAETGKAG